MPSRSTSLVHITICFCGRVKTGWCIKDPRAMHLRSIQSHVGLVRALRMILMQTFCCGYMTGRGEVRCTDSSGRQQHNGSVVVTGFGRFQRLHGLALRGALGQSQRGNGRISCLVPCCFGHTDDDDDDQRERHQHQRSIISITSS